jgi:hypothetical protein
MSTVSLSENQKFVLSTLVSRGAHFVADVTRSHWEKGESYYLDARCGAANGIRRKFNQGNKEALAVQPH